MKTIIIMICAIAGAAVWAAAPTAVDDAYETAIGDNLSEEAATLRSQIATSKTGRGGRRYSPRVFSEHGILMLSSVPRSKRAIEVNITIMRTFVKLRQMLATHADLARRLAALERRYDEKFRVVFDAIRHVLAPPTDEEKRRIGFSADEE